MGSAQPPPCVAVLAGAGAVGMSHKKQLRSNSVSNSGKHLWWRWGGPTARLGLDPLRMRSSRGDEAGALLGLRGRKFGPEFGPEEGKKEKQVRKKQEGGTSKGDVTALVAHVL